MRFDGETVQKDSTVFGFSHPGLPSCPSLGPSLLYGTTETLGVSTLRFSSSVFEFDLVVPETWLVESGSVVKSSFLGQGAT